MRIEFDDEFQEFLFCTDILRALYEARENPWFNYVVKSLLLKLFRAADAEKLLLSQTQMESRYRDMDIDINVIERDLA